MLLTLYIVTLIVGGGMVAVSAVAGSLADGDADLDADADADLHLDVDMHADMDVHADVDAHSGNDFHPDAAGFAGLTLFLKFKFWTFFLAFFGLTGFLTLKFGVAPWATVVAAAGMGFVCGFMMAWILERLKAQQHSSHASVDRMLGREANVYIAVRGQTPGRIRVMLGGRTIELIAVSDVPDRIEAGSRVVIVAADGGKVRVVPVGYLS